MILHALPHLNKRTVVLASASPRRLEILRGVGLHPEVVKSTFAEDLDKRQYTPEEYAEATAACKARDVGRQRPDAALVIAGDTVVEVDGDVLEKPADAAEAASMLCKLRGRSHKVHTGVALLVPQATNEARLRAFHETTIVHFAAVSDDEVAAYVATGESFDKAGAYGVQGPAAMWVRRLEGCYFNVMGFPAHCFAAAVSEMIEAGQLQL